MEDVLTLEKILRKEGWEEGLEEGRKEGYAEGIQIRLERVVLMMLQKQVPVEEIQELIGWSEEVLDRFQAKQLVGER